MTILELALAVLIAVIVCAPMLASILPGISGPCPDDCDECNNRKGEQFCQARIDGGEWEDISPDAAHTALMHGYEVRASKGLVKW